MASRITIQDIADAIGVSRNTVSKAINNSPGLAPATREKILQKAAEMGYKQFSCMNTVWQGQLITQAMKDPSVYPALSGAQPPLREIAFFSSSLLGGSHFAITMLDKFQREISQMGYSLTIHRITEEEVRSLRLPITFTRSCTSGILCAEVLDNRYAQMLCQLDIPLLFVDAPLCSADGIPPIVNPSSSVIWPFARPCT